MLLSSFADERYLKRSCLQFIDKERRKHPGKGGSINGSGEKKKTKERKRKKMGNMLSFYGRHKYGYGPYQISPSRPMHAIEGRSHLGSLVGSHASELGTELHLLDWNNFKKRDHFHQLSHSRGT